MIRKILDKLKNKGEQAKAAEASRQNHSANSPIRSMESVSIDELATMSNAEKQVLVTKLDSLPNGAELAVGISEDNDPNIRGWLAQHFKKINIPNKPELADKFSSDPERWVRECLARNIEGLSNAEEMAERLSNDNVHVRIALASSLNTLSNGADLAVKLNQDPSKEVRRVLAYFLPKMPETHQEAVKLNQRITFHIPADNQALTGHEANLSVQLSQNTLNRLTKLQSTAATLPVDYMVLENDANDSSAPLIELDGVTFDGNEAPIHQGRLSITENGDVTIQADSDGALGQFESYDCGINLKHLQAAFTHALDIGSQHIVIDDTLNAQFTLEKPAIVNEVGLFNVEKISPNITKDRMVNLALNSAAVTPSASQSLSH